MKSLRQDPTDPEFVQNPYPFYAQARETGDFFFWEDYDLICAASHRAVSAVLRNRSMGREAPPEKQHKIEPHTADFYAVEAHSMLELEPPRHTRLRGLVLRAFTSRRIAALEPEITQLCEQLAGELGNEPIDLINAYCAKVPIIVIARLLGVPESMADQLLKWSHDMVAMYQARKSKDDEIAASIAAKKFADFMRGYIAERRATPADDLITHLIAAESEGERLSTDEMITTCILLLNAGHEATVHTLGNGVKTILENGISLDHTAPSKVATLVEEIMRYDPPLHLFTRWINAPVQEFGVDLAPGTEVGALLASAGRDSTVTEHPDLFVPDRQRVEHLAFGAGLHFCVGAPLARLEMQIALTTLFTKHPNLKIVEQPIYANLYHFHGLERLMVST